MGEGAVPADAAVVPQQLLGVVGDGRRADALHLDVGRKAVTVLAGGAAAADGPVVADRAVAAGHGDGRAEVLPDVFQQLHKGLAHKDHIRAVRTGELIHPKMLGDLAAALGFEGVNFDVVHGLSFLNNGQCPQLLVPQGAGQQADLVVGAAKAARALGVGELDRPQHEGAGGGAVDDFGAVAPGVQHGAGAGLVVHPEDHPVAAGRVAQRDVEGLLEKVDTGGVAVAVDAQVDFEPIVLHPGSGVQAGADEVGRAAAGEGEVQIKGQRPARRGREAGVQLKRLAAVRVGEVLYEDGFTPPVQKRVPAREKHDVPSCQWVVRSMSGVTTQTF